MKEFDVAIKIIRDRFHPVMDIQEEMICLFDKNFNITYANQAYCKYLKKQPNELIGTSILEFAAKTEHVRIQKALSTINTKKPLVKITYQAKSGKSTNVWQEWKNTALFDEKGEVVEFQAAGKDVTEFKKIKDENGKLKSAQIAKQKDMPSFIGKQNGKKIIINANEIAYIKANLISIEIVCSNKKAKVSLQIKEADRLLKDFNFFRVHRSYLVNLDKVKSMDSINESKYKIYFYDLDETVISSKRGAKELRKRLKS